MHDSVVATSIPRIATDRLLLRELRTSDFDAYAAHMADSEAMEHMSGAVTRRMAWNLFCALSGQWMVMGAGWWAVEVRETGTTIGTVGAFFRESSLQLAPDRELELGWSVYRAYWRRGYAREAAAAALDYGMKHQPEVPRAIAHIAAANAASIGVSRTLGMTYDGAIDFYGSPCNRYSVERLRLDL